MVVNRLPFVVCLGARPPWLGRDRLGTLVGLEAQEELLFARGARLVAQAAGRQHGGVVHLEIFGVDGGDAIQHRQRLGVTSIEEQGARQLIERILAEMSPAGRLIITLLEIEDRSVKEIAQLTGWSVTLVKVRAFRARAEMKKLIARMTTEKYL